ncbi:MAG: 50S ribosomal protein L24 [Desulfobacterales bacterium]|nr:50S ribosomal protein L24 [Desulfobacterales bacterium]MDD4070799.1 50S ribosomal protein L24 [Desulfobacterales bacterium]MDD4391201.1 50S ribosomal protein L24 [Desulfobacterales bacterium]
MAREKCLIKKEDKVKVITGKDSGKIGKILKIDNKTKRIVVEKINLVKKHMKPNAQNRQGGIIEKEAPIHRSNIMLMCNKCMTPVRIKMQILDDGKKIRMCSKCNEPIDA